MAEENNNPTPEPVPAEPQPEPVHQETEKFACKDCNGKFFKSKQGLKLHVEKYHPKAPASTTSRASAGAQQKTRKQQKSPEKEGTKEGSFLDRLFFNR